MVCCLVLFFFTCIFFGSFLITWKPWSSSLMVRPLIASDSFGVGLGFVARYLEERDRMVSGWSLTNQEMQIPKFSRPSQYHHTSHHSEFLWQFTGFPFFLVIKKPGFRVFSWKSIHQSIRIACRLIDPTFILPAYPWSLGHVEAIATRGFPSWSSLSGWAAKESGSHHVCHAHRCEALHGPQGNASRRVAVGSVANMTWHVACDERYSQL